MSYPKVHSELDTLAKLREGYSIARFGDGEFKMIDGAGYVREPPNARLAGELRDILRHPPKNLIRAIPTMDPAGPKFDTWKKHTARFTRLLRGARGEFYSAFISRPDSAPWIRTREFAEAYQSVWRGKRIWLLAEETSGAARLLRGEDVVHNVCPSHQAYRHIDDYEAGCWDYRPDIAIMACGMTATCLAARLARRGIQALDFGSGGKFLAELLE